MEEGKKRGWVIISMNKDWKKLVFLAKSFC